jgi:hypothetical protein
VDLTREILLQPELEAGVDGLEEVTLHKLLVAELSVEGCKFINQLVSNYISLYSTRCFQFPFLGEVC